jgi:hypothetical protein
VSHRAELYEFTTKSHREPPHLHLRGLSQANIGETLQRLSGSLEEPFEDSSILPTFYGLTQQHVTVALAGDEWSARRLEHLSGFL